jgi:chemotaxis protein methyltransferase CheR
LGEAKLGIYKAQKSASIPMELLRAFALQGTGEQEGNLKIIPAVQNIIQLQRLNLNQLPPRLPQDFDAIFCRNVLIYFDAESKKKTVNALLDHLRPDGMLFLGHAENLNGMTSRVRNIAPTIYQRADFVPQ